MEEKRKGAKKRKRKIEALYLIWEYYHKIQLTKDSPIKCVCKFCNRVYLCHKKRLLTHLVGACKKCPENIRTFMRTIEKKVVSDKKENEIKRQDDNQDEENVEEYSAIEKVPLDKKSKNTKCFVYGCNRTRAEFAFFPAPNELREREIWNSIITHPFQQRDLRATDFICERHFVPSDVIRYLVVDGVRIPNKSPVLRRGCLPIKFFDHYVLKSYNRHITKLITKSEVSEKRKRSECEDDHEQTSKYTNKEILTDSEVIEELAPNPEYEIVFENEKSCNDFEKPNDIVDIQNEKSVVKTEPYDDNILLDDKLEIDLSNIGVEYNIDTLIKPDLCNMDIPEIKDEVDYDSDSTEDEDVEINFFERIFETKSFPGLNDYWAICPCKNYVKPILQNLVSEDRSVVFIKMKVRNAIPIIDKQIILTEDLKLDYFVGHNQIKENDLVSEISTTTELATAINHYSTLNTCEGGPGIDDKGFVFGSYTTTYYKDFSSRTWRHKCCNFISQSGTACIHCKYVTKYFKRKQKLNERKPANIIVLTGESSANEDLGENYVENTKEDNLVEL